MKSRRLSLVAIPPRAWWEWPDDVPIGILANDAFALERRIVNGGDRDVERGIFLQLARRIDALALARLVEDNSTHCVHLTGELAEASRLLTVILYHDERGQTVEHLRESSSLRGAWNACLSMHNLIMRLLFDGVIDGGDLSFDRAMVKHHLQQMVRGIWKAFVSLVQWSLDEAVTAPPTNRERSSRTFFLPEEEVRDQLEALRSINPDHLKREVLRVHPGADDALVDKLWEVLEIKRNFFGQAHRSKSGVIEVLTAI